MSARELLSRVTFLFKLLWATLMLFINSGHPYWKCQQTRRRKIVMGIILILLMQEMWNLNVQNAWESELLTRAQSARKSIAIGVLYREIISVVMKTVLRSSLIPILLFNALNAMRNHAHMNVCFAKCHFVIHMLKGHSMAAPFPEPRVVMLNAIRQPTRNSLRPLLKHTRSIGRTNCIRLAQLLRLADGRNALAIPLRLPLNNRIRHCKKSVILMTLMTGEVWRLLI
jgi:hypothetical protein